MKFKPILVRLTHYKAQKIIIQINICTHILITTSILKFKIYLDLNCEILNFKMNMNLFKNDYLMTKKYVLRLDTN